MLGLYYNALCAAIASLAASTICKQSLESTSEGSKRSKARAIILGAVVGTLVLAAGLELPNRVAIVRRFVRPESAIEGIWIQTHVDTTMTKYALVRIEYKANTRTYCISGRTYRVTQAADSAEVSLRSDWTSITMCADSKPSSVDISYAYSAKLWHGNILHATGIGYTTFDTDSDGNCHRARGYYADDQLSRDPTRFNLARLPDSLSVQFDSDPIGLVMDYHKSPKLLASGS